MGPPNRLSCQPFVEICAWVCTDKCARSGSRWVGGDAEPGVIGRTFSF